MLLRFTRRCLKVFYTDLTSVLFSVMAVCIVIGIYILFLGDIWTDLAAGSLENSREIMDCWIMGGSLAIIPVTSTLGAFSAMVDDRVRKIEKDLICSPLRRFHIAGGYILSAFSVGVIMSLLALILAEVYIVNNGGNPHTFEEILKLIGVIAYNGIFSTVALYFIVSFFRSNGAFLTTSVVVGVLIGFFTGCYLPIGLLPEGVQNIVKMFPPSHAASLMRQIMMKAPLDYAFSLDTGHTERDWFENFMGVKYIIDGEYTTATQSLIFIGGAIALFLLAVAIKELFSRKRRG